MHTQLRKIVACAGLTLCLAACAAFAGADQPDAARARSERLAGDLLRDLVAINTAPSGGPGQTLKAARLLAGRLRAAGFPDADVRVLGLAPGDGNLVARLRSTRPLRRPILLMAHFDVVEAVRAEWDTDPFTLVEKDGYWYGRGTADLKNGCAMLAAILVRLREEGFRPDRDLVLFFTADEETTMANTRWLVTEQRDLIDAAFALNTDAGYVDVDGERPEAFVMQTAEKLYASFRLEATGPSLHSSLPSPDNAIYKLAAVLQRLRTFEFPRSLNASTQAWFRSWAAIAPAGLRAGASALGAGRLDDPAVDAIEGSSYLKASLRTTCVATELAGGQAENALPARAEAVVNCRILPQSSAAAVEAVLRDLASAEGVTVTPMQPAVPAPESPLDPAIVGPIEAVAAEIWPGIPLLPQMSPGASDGMFLRNAGIPTYGIGAVAMDPDEDRSHAANERIRIGAFNDAMGYWYRLAKRLATP